MTDRLDLNAEDPLALFTSWMHFAEENEPNDPNAAALATATPDGEPSVRMVLAKPILDYPFCFFTNTESRKCVELAANPRASLCFHWKTLRRQVRVEGAVNELDAPLVDDYFHSRPRMNQINAVVSQQSRILSSRAELEQSVREFSANNPGQIPRPAFWSGYRLNAARIEFWIQGHARLHHRVLFTRAGDQWLKSLLYP
jgi:pyridoxamine 5'-phosphate oxidase